MKPFFAANVIEAGCDEAGRGCLAGPVFAASVILRTDFYHPLLNDSKQVTEEHRYELRPIIESSAIAWAVASIDHTEIDRINILNASFKAMHRAIDQLETRPQLLLIDGNIFPAYMGITHRCIVKGDAKYASIAAASILAKTYRDDEMMRLHQLHPPYGWDGNKGYATTKHRKMIREYGLSPYHRRTFGICKEFFEADNLMKG